MINPGTVAAIAASLMAQGECWAPNSEIRSKNYRRAIVKEYVELAWMIAEETNRQKPTTEK